MCDIDSFAPLSPLLQGTKYRQTTENTHRSALLFFAGTYSFEASSALSFSRRASPDLYSS